MEEESSTTGEQMDDCAHSSNAEESVEYSLTVTEESLLRLHGLSLTLPIPCDLCPPGTVFDDLDEFDAHMSDHPEAKMFACQLCSNTYKSWSNLVAHRKVFHHGEVLCCVDCSVKRSHARLEGSVHFPVEGKPHGCEECMVGLDSVTDMYRHFSAHGAPPGAETLVSEVEGVGKTVKVTTEEEAEGSKEPAADDEGNEEGAEATGEKAEPAADIGQASPHLHQCPHCPFSSPTLDSYRHHLSSNARAHRCPGRGRPSSHKHKALPFDHEYCNSQPQHFDCAPCARLFLTEESFSEHLTITHASEKRLPCCSCGLPVNISKLIEHRKACKKQHGEWEGAVRSKINSCRWCGKVFRRTSFLQKHMETNSCAGKRRECGTCGRSFCHSGAYAKHLWANPDHGPKPDLTANFVCEVCGRTFSKKDGLKVHLMRHRGIKPYACNQCPKAFLSRFSLMVHARQHTGERPYMCEICGKNFTGPTSLYVHQRSHRGSKRRHICPVCGKALSSKYVFEGHVRRHFGERPFSCSDCGKSFSTMKMMRSHAKRHTVERVEVPPAGETSTGACIYLCPDCNVGLLSPEELESHMGGGGCPGGGSEMFVLPMSGGVECVEAGGVVELLPAQES